MSGWNTSIANKVTRNWPACDTRFLIAIRSSRVVVVALVAGVDAVIYHAPSSQPNPLVGLLRGALLGQQDPIEFDRHLLRASADLARECRMSTSRP